jgi:uncharacterized protein (TIGR00255 family)
MKSMTGYGRASTVVEGRSVTVQVSSVNRKSLDLTIACPAEWESLESSVATAVRTFASRGKVHVDVELSVDRSGALAWDEAAALEVTARFRALCVKAGFTAEPTPELLWQVLGAQRGSGGAPSAEVAAASVLAALNEALSAFAAMRAREGTALLADFTVRCAAVRTLVESIAQRAPQVPGNYRETLHRRLREAGLELDLADERVLREIALFADRIDVTEEITRLRSHLEQFGALLNSDQEIGRKAEFILQEMGREVNTVGSKANDLEISRTVIELKNELERIREQIANVE